MQISPPALRVLNGLRLALLPVVLVAGIVGAARAAGPAGLRLAHPRLLATPDDWTRLAERRAAEPELAAYHAALIAAARKEIAAPPATYVKPGRRLLSVSRAVVQRVLLLGYAWRTTGDEAFARRAETEMLAVAAFPDWNPSHFLD